MENTIGIVGTIVLLAFFIVSQKKQRTFKTILFILLNFSFVNAQETLEVEGVIRDKTTNEVLPYATIRILRTLKGTLSNEKGKFNLVVSTNDSLSISYLGYQNLIIPASFVNKEKTILLHSSIAVLGEVTVLPKPPEYYIKKGVKNYYSNNVKSSYSTRSFFQNGFEINNSGDISSLRDQSVFYSYHNRKGKIQNRLILHKRKTEGETINLPAFLVEKIKKMSDTTFQQVDSINNISLNELQLTNPYSILNLFSSAIKNPSLDSTHFQNFRYRFDKSLQYEDKNLIVISFSSKKKIKLQKYKGEIYINPDDKSIFGLKYEQKTVIPLALKPIVGMFLGFNIKKIHQTYSLMSQELNGMNYPKYAFTKQNIILVDRHLFKKNDVSTLFVNSILNIDEVNTKNPKPVSPPEVFNSQKTLNDQLFNHEQLKWSDINVIPE